MEAGAPAGCVYARVGEAGTGHIGSMWVAPTHRRQGLGRQLLEIGVERLRGIGVTTAQLWVAEGNLAATSLYLDAGFVFTGARDTLREGSSLMRVQMQKALVKVELA